MEKGGSDVALFVARTYPTSDDVIRRRATMDQTASLLPKLLSEADFATSGDEARTFCLRIIKEFYGIDYTPAWHADLDSLRLAGDDNWFTEKSRGAFFVVRNEQNEIIATGGLCGLARKPGTAERLKQRYAEPAETCQVVRVYLDQTVRRHGLGTRIVTALEAEARTLGYALSYLHADALAAGTLRFWNDRGYREFDRFSYPSPKGTDTSVDFDKRL
jgi:GNAT superfamily N-acetyltransferase